jgi:hypothetical protein
MPSYLFMIISSRFQAQNIVLIILPRYKVTNFTLSFITPHDWQEVLPFVPQTQTTYMQKIILRVTRILGYRHVFKALPLTYFCPESTLSRRKEPTKVACYFTACIASASTQTSASVPSKPNNDQLVLDRLLKQKHRPNTVGCTSE